MNPSTARSRLIKSILWALIEGTDKSFCYRCGTTLTEDSFSIEHKSSWMESENPIETYFDLGNIAFSHLGCNSRHTSRLRHSNDDEKKESQRKSNRKYWTKDRRKDYYTRTGK